MSAIPSLSRTRPHLTDTTKILSPSGRPGSSPGSGIGEHRPINRWAEDGALRELVRLADDLLDVDADEAWCRLGRLTGEQPPDHLAGCAVSLDGGDPVEIALRTR